MNKLFKVYIAAALAGVVAAILLIGPILALTMAYLLWGIKGALFTLGLLLSK